LINPSNPDPPPNYFGPPYGLSLIGGALLRKKISVAAYDFDLLPQETMITEARRALKRHRPRLIGITAQSCTRGPVYALLEMIKKERCPATIVLGGAFVSDKHELLLRNFPVDYCVIGDGEETLPELIAALQGTPDPAGVKGLAYLRAGRLVRTAERFGYDDLDLLPYPAFHLFDGFDRKINVSRDRAVPDFILGRRCTSFKNALLMLSSRGCVFRCVFCPMSKVKKDKIRFHSPAYFTDMVAYFYRKYKIRNFVFGDNFFTYRKQRVLDICGRLRKRRLKIRWSCMTRSDFVDPVLLKAMAAAGCFEIFYGVESGSARIQATLGKRLDLEKTKRAFVWTQRAGIRCVPMFMVGNIGDSERTMRETARFIAPFSPDNLLVKITKVYPATALHDIYERAGKIDDAYYVGRDPRPPSNTLEHSEQELERLSAFIQPRTTTIEIDAGCNNNCRGCDRPSAPPRRDKSLRVVRQELRLAATRAEQVVLAGSEGMLRSDIGDIFATADALEIRHLHLYTNARLFFYKDAAVALGRIRALTKALIPFFGGARGHDMYCRTPDAFQQTVQGVRNLRRHSPGVSLQALIYLFRSGMDALPDLVRFLRGLGIDDYRFIFHGSCACRARVPLKESPTMSQAQACLAQRVLPALGADGSFMLEGFPLCILNGHAARHFEPYRPFDETITGKSVLLNDRQRRCSQKTKFRGCKNCKESHWCEGAWKDYADEYGCREFRAR